MINERSAGAILYNSKNKRFLLLYKAPSEKYKEMWGFPRGIIEEEDEKTVVEREIKEEAGIEDIKFIPKFRETISFVYRKDGELIRKEVIFYLAKTNQEKVTLSYEHNDYKWAEYEEALKLITHNNVKEVFKKASEFMKEKAKQKTLDNF